MEEGGDDIYQIKMSVSEMMWRQEVPYTFQRWEPLRWYGGSWRGYKPVKDESSWDDVVEVGDDIYQIKMSVSEMMGRR